MLLGMWDLSSLHRDGTVSLAVKAWSPNHWTAREFLNGKIFKVSRVWVCSGDSRRGCWGGYSKPWPAED